MDVNMCVSFCSVAVVCIGEVQDLDYLKHGAITTAITEWSSSRIHCDGV